MASEDKAVPTPQEDGFESGFDIVQKMLTEYREVSVKISNRILNNMLGVDDKTLRNIVRHETEKRMIERMVRSIISAIECAEGKEVSS